MSVINNFTKIKMAYASDEAEQEYIFDSIYVRCIFITLYTIVFCFCVFGNLLVILVVTLHWKMRNITKFCLGNLAFADFCVGIFCVCQNLATYLIHSWVLGDFWCKIYQFINALSHTASVLILVVICVERYLAILHPLRCKQILTIKRLRILIVCVWLVSALYCSPRLYYFGTFQVPEMAPGGQVEEIICIAQRTRFDSKTFDMIHFFLLFLLPLLVFSVLYTKMGLFLWRSCHSQFLLSTPCPSPSPSHNLNRGATSVNQSRKFSTNLCVGPSPIDPTKRYSNSTACTSHTVHNNMTSFTTTVPPNPNSINLSSGSQSPRAPFIPNCKALQETRSQHNQLLSEACSQTRRIQSVKTFNCQRTRSLIRSSSCLRNIRNESQSESFESSSTRTAVGSVVGRGDSMKSRQTVVKMLIVIVLTFALCNFPFHLRKICQYWWPKYNYTSTFSTLLVPLTQLIVYANCALNPIIYAFMSTEFRSSFKDLLCCRWRKPLYLVVSQGGGNK